MPTTTIHVDMFEVQLGAAVLLQFKTAKGRIVRVLADAGIKAGGYPKEHVRDKLPAALKSFAPGDRIDLIIGTHYDEDHLEGLVPIVQDARFMFGEAWMPPVTNDEAPRGARRGRTSSAPLLVEAFAGEGGAAALRAYLISKEQKCRALMAQETQAAGGARRTRGGVGVAGGHRQVRALVMEPTRRGARGGPPQDLVAEATAIFREHIQDANITLKSRGDGHGDTDPRGLFDANAPAVRGRGAARRGAAALGSGDAITFAELRKSEARKAINAASLARVVQALNARKVPIRCELIPDGKPRRFVWNATSRSFKEAGGTTAGEVEFVLLGPSVGLAKKHEELLPVSKARRGPERGLIPMTTITESNQLSYIGRFSAGGQNILVSGDAGCVDFMTARNGPYHPALLAALKDPLHIVQVAHHAGNNAHFYRVLEACGYERQPGDSFLLLSHATHDPTRPSPAFAAFVGNLKGMRPGMRILFTSTPTSTKVSTFRPRIHKTVGAKGEVGDIALVFDGKKWAVTKHAVQV